MAEVNLKEANRVFHDYEAGKYDGKWGIRYDLDAAAQVRAKYEKVLEGSFPRSKKVLEVGCGTGFVILNLNMEEGLIGEAYACDISQGMVDVCRDNAERLGAEIDVRRAEMEDLPYPDEYFDLVLGHAILHHVPDVRGALKEVYRVLRPGGVCLLAGEPTRMGDKMGKLARRMTTGALNFYVAHGGYFGGLPARPREEGRGDQGEPARDLENLVDVHTFRPSEVVEVAGGVGYSEARYHGEELLSSFVGWVTRTVENTLSEENLTFRWRMWSYRTHLKLAALDEKIYKYLPSSWFYNMLLYLKR